MSNNVASVAAGGGPLEVPRNGLTRFLGHSARGLANFVAGLAILLALWWLGIYLVLKDPSMSQFADFSPMAAFEAFPEMWEDGSIPSALQSSGYRLGMGLLIAILIGVPIGIIMGRVRWFQKLSNVPFQFLRMVSPLSWEPIAVIVFPEWDQAIIFLIAMASVWPVMFSTAAGLAKVDPNWFKVARNLGARPWHIVVQIIIPAITFDVLTGIRLALGVAWIVLIPAEFLGVTSGFGYSIEDARESLEYSHLMALVVVIGAVGYVLDGILMWMVNRSNWTKQA